MKVILLTILCLLSMGSSAFATNPSNDSVLDNGPILELMADVTVCSGSVIELTDLPIEETTGANVDYTYHAGVPISPQNEILTGNVVITGNDTIYVAADDGLCTTVLQVPIEYVISPILVFSEVIQICSGEEVDISQFNVEDLENTGSAITFHTSNNPTPDNEIINPIISPGMTTNIYAFSELGVCEYILPISINVKPSPDLFVTTEPVICTGLDLNLDDLLITDLNNTGAGWTLHSALPATAQNEILDQIVNYSSSTVIYAVAQSGGCLTELPINVTVTSSLYAGEDEQGLACEDAGAFDLATLVTPNANPGTFVPVQANPYFNAVTNTIDSDAAPAGTYSFLYIVAADGQCLSDTALLELVVQPKTNAGQDNFREICEGISGPVDMGQFLNGASSSAGTWRQLTGPTLNVSNPSMTDFSNVPSDTLIFQYILQGPEECLPDTSLITIDVTPAPVLDGSQSRCSDDLNSYTFVFWTQHMNVTTDFGTITSFQDGFQVENIPITQAINITLVNVDNCSNTIHVNPPDCDCAFVPLPTFIGNVSVCEGVPVPTMDVLLEPGVGANWYDEPFDGTLLFQNGIAFNPSIIAPGRYIYFVEVYSLSDPDCFNESRIPVSLDIWPYPNINIIDAFGCVSDDMAFFDFDEVAKTFVDGSIYEPSDSLKFEFYESESDAIANSNPLPTAYEANINSLGSLYATVEFGGGCQTIAEVELQTSPNPDVTFGVNNITCDIETGGVWVVNNDLSQDITFSYNLQEFTSVLFVDGLFGGNAILKARNQYGCEVQEWVFIETQTGIAIESQGLECNGNGTPSDATDDYQVMTFNLSSSTGSLMFEAVDIISGNSFGLFPYDVDNDIIIPVNGDWVVLEFIDQDNMVCSTSLTLGYLETCSAQCGITGVSIVGSECYDNNTPANPFDDKFYLDVEVLAVNASDGWILDGDLQFTGSYTNTQRVGPFDIEDHEGVLIFQDNNSSNCFFELEFDVPDHCSNQCGFASAELYQVTCDDSFTGPIPDDDTYYITLVLSNINIGKEDYLVVMEGDTLGPFIYDELIEFYDVDPTPLSEVSLTVIDLENQACEESFSVLITPCSECIETTNILQDTLNLNCVADPEIAEVAVSLEGDYEWLDLSNNAFLSDELTPGIGQLGSFELTVNHDNLCVSSDTVFVIQENVYPEADAGDPLVINCIDTTVTLSGLTTHPANNYYEWYDSNDVLVSGSEDGLFTTNLEGSYFLRVIDTLYKCESALSEVQISRNDVIPNFTLDIFPIDTLTCYAEEIEVNPVESLAGHDVSWMIDGSLLNQDSVLIEAIGIYSMQVQDEENGCVQNLDFEIFKNADYPLIDIEFPDTLNCINDMVILDGSQSSVEPTISNQWYAPNFNAIANEEGLQLEVNTGGMYYLELDNAENGCTEIDSIFVVQDQILPNIEAGVDDFIRCFEENYILSGEVDSIDNFSFSWVDEEGNNFGQDGILNPEILVPGTYFLNVLNETNYCNAIDSVVIVEDPSLIHGLDVYSDDPLCYLDENGFIIVQDVVTAGTNLQYYFNGQTSIGGNMLENQVGGDFLIEVINDEGCIYDTLVTLVDPYVLTLDLNVEEQEIINLGDSLHIEAVTNILPENIATVEWSNPSSHTSPNQLETSIFPYSHTSYEIIVTDEAGCIVSNHFSVLVTEEVYLYFPNIFSLSPGSENSEFMILGDRQVEEITLFEIYDRWGNKVFETSNFRPGEEGSGWDGQYNGAEAAAGVYIYRAEARLKNGKEKFYVGDVTLVK